MSQKPSSNELDTTSAAQPLELRIDNQSGIDRLIVGNQVLDTRLQTEIGATHLSNGELRLRNDASLMTKCITTNATSIRILSGEIHLSVASHQNFQLANGTHLRLAGGPFIGLTVDLEDANLAIRGDTTTVEQLIVRGTKSALEVAAARVVGLTIDSDSAVLHVVAGAEIIEAAGCFALTCVQRAAITAKASSALILTNATITNAAAVEGVDFFRLNPSFLTELEKVDCVSGSWPRKHRNLLEAGRSIDAGVRSSTSRLVARAHYWSAVETLLKGKNATGEDLVAAHRLAQDARRLAASRGSHERILLNISRTTGYGTRLFSPIIFWLGLAILIAVIVRALTTGITWGHGWESGAMLTWEIFVSPFTWMRPLNEGSTLRDLTNGHFHITVITFVARILGTYALAATALAARRHLRNP